MYLVSENLAYEKEIDNNYKKYQNNQKEFKRKR